MMEEIKQLILEAFIGEKRLKMRNALRYWCVDGGCVFLKIPRGEK